MAQSGEMLDMRAILNHMTVAAIAGLIVLGASSSAAVAPLSPENLRKEATHIITGRVLEVKSRTRKSKVEKTIGIHRDRVFTIRLRVMGLAKGKGVRKGDEIVVTAWQPVLRIPPLPGPQGHSSVPKNGEVVTVHVASREGVSFVPFMPNGIRIENPNPAARD